MSRDALTVEERELLSSGTIPADRETMIDTRGDESDHPGEDTHEGLARELDAIHSFHVEVARRFEDALSNGLQQIVDIKLTHAQAVTYSQFAFGRDNPTCLVIVQAVPLSAPLAIDLCPALLYPLLDCMLGGGKRACVVPDRPPTELEQRLARRIVEVLLNELHDAWEPVLAVDLTVDRIESNAQRVRLVAPSDPIIQLEFQVRVAEQTGDLTLCLPRRAIRKMVDKLLVGECLNGDSTKMQSTDAKDVVVRIAGEKLSPSELSQLEVGDVIMTNVDADGCVDILIDGRPAFTGRPGAVGNRRAVEIEG